jgi:hypothetical protein
LVQLFLFFTDGCVSLRRKGITAMTRVRKLVLLSLSCSSLLGACRRAEDEVDSFRNGIPRQETVEMKVPAASGQALTVESNAQALRGATADTYKLTRGVSLSVNGGGALVLALVKLVVSHPPTKLEGDSAIWGPWRGGPLDPLAYKVTVKRVGDKFDYTFEGRDKNALSGDFTAFLSGAHTPARDGAGDPIEGFGSGTFTLDWDARAKLPAPGDEVGKAVYVYSRLSPAAAVEVDAQFRQVKDDERPGVRVDVDYLYRATPGAGGSMEFLHSVPATMAAQGARWAVKSRWMETGAGRTDIKASGGTLPAEVQASECWNTSFASVFLTASWAPAGGWGDEAADCVFKPADYSKL